MKIHKKIGTGLILITVLATGLLFSHKAGADPTFSASWIDRSNIQVTGAGKTIVLTDGVWDKGWEYSGTIDGCKASKIDGFDGNLIVGFGKSSDGKPGPGSWNDSVSKAKNFEVNYKANATDTSCTSFSGGPVNIANSQNAQITYRWTDSEHTSITRIDDGGKWKFSHPITITSGFDSGKIRFFRESEAGQQCQDVIDVSGGTMWLYEQANGKNSPVDPTHCKLYATINDLTAGSGMIDDWNHNLPSNYPLPLDEPFTPPNSGGGGSTTKTPQGPNEACYTNWELSWIACPVITAAQTAANSMYGFVEDQLKFRVPDDLGGQGGSVHDTWNNFRVLVSGLVVILMLVMVISQAIGSGPFDAYTVKKMLPRLVIGVILIQISWPLFSWVINTVDDLGRGLADIMYAPFGGTDALSLSKILGQFGPGAEIFSFVGIPALIIFGVVAPFVVLGIILSVLVAIFMGFLALLFRKILIILCLILVPLALISWMMPSEGLRKYWKLWQDNFIKALFMYPLIVAIIAGGRIFAKVGGGQNHDFVGFFIVLVGFFGPLFILPKTFKWGGTAMQLAGNALTKAQTATLKKPKEFLGERQKGYKEERRLQSKERVAAGEGFNPRRPWRYPVDKFLSGQWDPTLTRRRAERALATYKKTGRDAYTEDLGAARIGQQIDWEHLQEGGWVLDEDGNRIAKRGAKDDYLQDALEDKHSDYIDGDGKNWGKMVYETDDGRMLNPTGKTRMEKLAALYEMEKLGGATNYRHILRNWEKVQKEAHENPQAYSDFRRFMSDSVGTMLPKLTDVYKGTASSADAGPGGVANQHGTEVENMLAELTHNVRTAAPGTAARINAEDMLRTYVGSYLSAAKTDNLRGGMEQGGKRAIKALVTTNTGTRDDILRKIHEDPEDGRRTLGFEHWEIQTGDDIRNALGTDMADELDRIIKDDGNFDEKAIKNPSASEDETEIDIEHDEPPPGPPPAGT